MKSKKKNEYGLKEEWDGIPTRGILSHESKLRMWKNIKKATIDKRKRNYRWIAAACVLLFLSVAGYQSFFYHTISPSNTLATTTFARDIRLLRLPDGTRVWINQNTIIEYPEQFNSKERAITLKGEAFFEVAKDPTKPFVITSGDIKTTVLGTSFNVKAYSGMEPEVHVRTGKVRVETDRNVVLLERGYSALFSPKSGILKKEKTNVLEPEWKKELLDVDGLTMGQVIEKLQTVHAFTVEYAEKDIENLKMKGTLDARQGYVKMLQTLAFALEVEVKSVGADSFIISR